MSRSSCRGGRKVRDQARDSTQAERNRLACLSPRGWVGLAVRDHIRSHPNRSWLVCGETSPGDLRKVPVGAVSLFVTRLPAPKTQVLTLLAVGCDVAWFAASETAFLPRA